MQDYSKFFEYTFILQSYFNHHIVFLYFMAFWLYRIWVPIRYTQFCSYIQTFYRFSPYQLVFSSRSFVLLFYSGSQFHFIMKEFYFLSMFIWLHLINMVKIFVILPKYCKICAQNLKLMVFFIFWYWFINSSFQYIILSCKPKLNVFISKSIFSSHNFLMALKALFSVRFC